MLLQEEISLRFCLKFALVSCDKIAYTICDGAISFPDSSFLRWVNEAWRDIPEEMVRRSFKTCGTSINALDGTEDDAVFDENIPEQKKK